MKKTLVYYTATAIETGKEFHSFFKKDLENQIVKYNHFFNECGIATPPHYIITIEILDSNN